VRCGIPSDPDVIRSHRAIFRQFCHSPPSVFDDAGVDTDTDTDTDVDQSPPGTLPLDNL
jgi:hypothetical protein